MQQRHADMAEDDIGVIIGKVYPLELGFTDNRNRSAFIRA